MKISNISSNYNKNTNKPNFGTLYGLDAFNINVTHFDDDLKLQMRKKVAELEKKYPDIDCYLEREREENTAGECSGIMKFLEKTIEPLQRPERTLLEHLLGKGRKGIEIPDNIYSAKRSMAWRSLDGYWDSRCNDPEKIFMEMYKEIEKGYKLIEESRVLGAKLLEDNPNISKPELVKKVREILCDPTLYEI